MPDILHFEDLEIGDVLETDYSDPIRTHLITRYCAITGETNESHLRKEFVEKFGLENLVVPGYLLQPLSAGLVRRDTPLRIHTIHGCTAKFIKPVYINDIIRIIGRVTEKEDRPDKPYGKVVFERELLKQDEILCAILGVDLRIIKKEFD